jgi:integrase
MDAVSKVLHMATKWTGKDGKALLAAKPPMPTVTVKNMKDRVLSPAEEQQVFASIDLRRQNDPGRPWRRFALLVRFLLDPGGRLGEALMTGPEDITTVPIAGGKVAHLVTFARYRTKSDKPRSIPLTDAVVGGLLSFTSDLGRKVLRTEDGRPYDKAVYFPFKEATAWYMWSNIRDDLKKVGFNVDDVTLHTLRHTCRTRLAPGGHGALRLQKWAGHGDPKITAERYVPLRTDGLLGGLGILQGSNGGNHGNGIFMEATPKRAAVGAFRLQSTTVFWGIAGGEGGIRTHVTFP